MKTDKVTKSATNERKTMGLAASQARLLTITARKADCEFMSMTLSHQKLALSRDMERVSTEYQNALTKTKLVYDYVGSADKQTDLTYSLLMNPSTYNDYLPKLVTDPTNRVILNSSYAAAARAAGIPAEGLDGLPSSDVRDAFIDALLNNGLITAVKASAVKGVAYNNTMGVGGSNVSATVSTEEITYGELMDRIEANVSLNSMNGNCNFENMINNQDTGQILGLKDFLDGLGNPIRVGATQADGTNSENQGDINTINAVHLKDLLTGDTKYYLSAQSAKGELTPISGIIAFQRGLVGQSENQPSFVNWLYDAFESVLGGVPSNETALQYAYNAVYDVLHPTNNVENWVEEFHDAMTDDKSERCEWFDGRWEDGTTQEILNGAATCHPNGKTNDGDYHENLAIDSQDYVGLLYTQELDGPGLHKDRNDRSQVAVNLNNLAKVFLTAYVQYYEGVENSKYEWNTGKLSDCYLYDPNANKDFKFLIASGIDVDEGDSALYAAFYDALFNRICLNGWTENDKVNDKDYMQELIKNGQAFISSMSDDGFYYQGNYAADRTILEVADDEAIARAQAKYNTEKVRIEYKENRIDLKMKNLDTEISALTTEYDTTKQLVSKTVEKSFKRYEA